MGKIFSIRRVVVAVGCKTSCSAADRPPFKWRSPLNGETARQTTQRAELRSKQQYTMNDSDYLVNLEEITSMYLDQHDHQLATAEERLLEVTKAKGDEQAEQALASLTWLIISVLGQAIQAAYLSGLAHGGVSLGVDHAGHQQT